MNLINLRIYHISRWCFYFLVFPTQLITLTIYWPFSFCSFSQVVARGVFHSLSIHLIAIKRSQRCKINTSSCDGVYVSPLASNKMTNWFYAKIATMPANTQSVPTFTTSCLVWNHRIVSNIVLVIAFRLVCKQCSRDF